MKKIYISIFTLLLSINTFSQQPYYNSISTELTTETGMTLFGTLSTLIIDTHLNTLDYDDARECLKIVDLEPGQTDNVLLIYGFSNNTCPTSTSDDNDHRLRDKDSFGGGSTCEWNREHVFAQSQGSPPLGQSGPGADAHHLRASDVQRNGQRSSLHFANGSGNSGSSGGGWYPGDEWKGDVARILMYMYVRYGSQTYPKDITIGTANSIDANMIDILLDWNAADPVSAYEDARNTYLENTANTYGQGNRNPFIDNPHLATRIWGGTPAEDRWGIYGTDTEAPSIPTGLTVSNETGSTIDLDWTASTDNVGVTGYDIYVDGMFNSSSTTNSHTVTGLATSTTYSFTVLAKDAANNMSAQSSAVDGTTTSGSSGGTDLFFSEYMEGTSSNKAIEIANVTGSPVDLSIYSVKLAANGNTDWSTATYNFPSVSLANDDVFVIGNSSLAVCTGVVDASSNVTFFGGNDVLGLFKNDVLIDILGTLGDTANFAQNVTLVRNSDINSPNTTYTPSEWTSYPVNTCDDLGSHTAVLSVEQNTLLSKIRLYPNPINGNILYLDTNQELEVKIIDILGKTLLTDSVNNAKKEVNISQLKTGTYFIKLTSENGSVTKKFIKQ